jgi:hypothetical protein
MVECVVGWLDMEFGLWDAVGIYRGGPGTGAGSRRISGARRRSALSKWWALCVCMHVLLEASGLLWNQKQPV